MSTPSPETHVFVGMFRPPFPEVLEFMMKVNKHGWIKNGCYHGWDDRGGGIDLCREAWLFGRYDEPVYKTIEEVVRMRQDAQVDLLPARQGT